jgi:predicted phage tail protein
VIHKLVRQLQRKAFPVARVCRVLRISCSGFYEASQRARKTPLACPVTVKLKALFSANDRCYGSTTAQGAALIAGGIGSAAGRVIQLLSPQASGLKQSASPDNQPSYVLGSANNTTASGNPVLICIGERRWGGAIIGASIYAEDKV